MCGDQNGTRKAGNSGKEIFMSILQTINAAAIAARNNQISANAVDTKKVLDEMREKSHAQEAAYAANILRRVTVGEIPLADVKVSTATIFRVVDNDGFKANVEVLRGFLAKYPNRLFVYQIGAYIGRTGDAEWMLNLYLGRLLAFGENGMVTPSWVKPEFLDEDMTDDTEFYYAVVSMFNALRATGAEKHQVRFIAGSLLSAYAGKLQSNLRLFSLIDAVRVSGVYTPPTQENSVDRGAAQQRSAGNSYHNNGYYGGQQRRPFPDNKYAKREDLAPATAPNGSADPALVVAVLTAAKPPATATLGEQLATKHIEIATFAKRRSPVRRPRQNGDTAEAATN